MTSPEDQMMIKKCVAGNRMAQGELYRKYVKAMYHIAIRLVKNPATARDLTQDVFIKVFEELKNYRGDATLGAWIKRITINTALSYLKKAGRLKWEDLNEDQFMIPEPEISMESPVQMSTIHRAIKTLPAGSRTVLSLFLLEGYQHGEIAEILDISISTSKTQYRRGKFLLQEKLKSVYYNED